MLSTAFSQLDLCLWLRLIYHDGGTSYNTKNVSDKASGTSEFPVLNLLFSTEVSKDLPQSDHSKHLKSSSSKFICEVYVVLVGVCENSYMH